MLGVLDPGDEVVIFEPFYENYGPDAILSGAMPQLVTLRPPDWTFDEDELRAAFTDRTRAIIINTPNNPTGKVFTREELTLIAELCLQHDAIAITDEIYEHIIYDGASHVPIATLDGMAERTVTISALSKTYSVTGWRVGWAIASADADGRHPQGARLPHRCGSRAAAGGGHHRARTPGDLLRGSIRRLRRTPRPDDVDPRGDAGSRRRSPAGAYYVMADCSHLGLGDDVATARHLVEHVGVATVPGSSFFSRPEDGAHLVRFAFCKNAGDARSGRRTPPRAPLVQFGLARCERVPEQIQAVRLEAEERPATALLTRQQTGVGEHLEVMAHGRLGQPERLREVAHAGFARRRDEAEQAEPGGIGHHAKRRGQTFCVVLGQGSLH